MGGGQFLDFVGGHRAHGGTPAAPTRETLFNYSFWSTYLSHCKEFEIVLQSAFELHPSKTVIENSV